MSLGDLNRAEPILLLALEKGSKDNGNMNLGQVYLCKNNKERALNYYKTSFSNYTIKAKFWKDMNNEFSVLKKYDISDKDYNEIKSQLNQPLITHTSS